MFRAASSDEGMSNGSTGAYEQLGDTDDDRARNLSIKQVLIQSYVELDGYTFYTVKCVARGKHFTKQRRFSEFVAFHDFVAPLLDLPRSFSVAKTTLPFQSEVPLRLEPSAASLAPALTPTTPCHTRLHHPCHI